MFSSERKKANKVARAIVEGKFELALKMLHDGAGPDGVYQAYYFEGPFGSPNECTSLMAAVHYGHVELVKLLLDKKANANERDYAARTALHYLLDQKDVVNDQIIHLLKNALPGILDIEAHDRFRALETVLYQDQYSAASALLRYGARPCARSLHLACFSNRPKLIEELLRHGADAHAKSDNGDTPLHVAAARGNGDVVRVLIEHGADPLALDAKMNNPAEAVQQKYPAIADFIRQAAENIKKKQSAETVADNENGWIIVSDDEIAIVSDKKTIGYKLTEIFNFTRAEVTTIARDLNTGHVGVAKPRRFDTVSNDILNEAAAHLKAQGGREVVVQPSKTLKLTAQR